MIIHAVMDEYLVVSKDGPRKTRMTKAFECETLKECLDKASKWACAHTPVCVSRSMVFLDVEDMSLKVFDENDMLRPIARIKEPAW